MTEHIDQFFGQFGGRYVAEVLWQPLEELERAFTTAWGEPRFRKDFDRLAADYVGRPTPLMHATNATRVLGGAQIYIKLEGLANTGAHKINNAIGQALLAQRMGKSRIIAETGAGQHGVATAAICAKLGMPCAIYMGEIDMARQHPNVLRMRLFGADVHAVQSGSRTLKDAVNEALRDWAVSFVNTHYLLGSALGPAPYPTMVREFQSIIGIETQRQLQAAHIDPVALIACVGGGSNSLGFFWPFIDSELRLIGVEAGGYGSEPGQHASRMTGLGRPGIVQGYKSLFLLDDDGQVQPTHSISAGLDYPGIGPQLAALGKAGRVEFTSATDDEAMEALRFFARHEGLLFALESAHAAAEAIRLAPTLDSQRSLVINMSGRGDKDLFIIARHSDPEGWKAFLEEEAQSIRPPANRSATAHEQPSPSPHHGPSGLWLSDHCRLNRNSPRPDTRRR